MSDRIETVKKNIDKRTHFHGFDYLRVFFMLMVLLGHSRFFAEAAAHRASSVGVGPNLWDYLYYEVQSSAVPSFILMSMVLFAIRKPDWNKTWDRVQKLGYLYLFWVGAWILCAKARPEASVIGVVTFLLQGGGWLFYTFATLIVLTPFCWLMSKLSRKQLVFALIVAIVMLGLKFTWLIANYKWTTGYYYWLPSNFVMMPIAAILLVPHVNRLVENRKLRYVVFSASLLLGVIFASIEWQFYAPNELLDRERHWLVKFSRPSVNFIALSMLILSLGCVNNAPRVIQYFARNSLGVYCLHPFMLAGLIKVVQYFAYALPVPVALFIGCLFSAIVCSLLTELLRKILKSRLV